MGVIRNSNYFPNLEINRGKEIKKQPDTLKKSSVKFEDFLVEKELKFSTHAKRRLESRNIKMDDVEMDKLVSGVEKLKAKGAKESVLLSDDRAYVVSVENSTVVTVVDKNSLKDNVFTNIDSMVKI